MNKIQRVSKFFAYLFTIPLILLPLTLIVFWINAPHPITLGHFMGLSISFIPNGTAITHTLSFTTKFIAFAISLIPVGIKLAILICLIKLFRLYEQGIVFSLKNVNTIKLVGYFILIGQALQPVYQVLITGVLTWGNGPGHRFATITLSQANIGALVTGGLLILVSWIMAEACQLREEQKLTV